MAEKTRGAVRAAAAAAGNAAAHNGAKAQASQQERQTSQKHDGKKVILNLIKPPEYIMPLTNGFDKRSQLGHFAWITIESVHVPYIFRDENTRMISVRIVNQIIFPRFFNTFKQKLFDNFVLQSYTMTDLERRLYNEINFGHCDCHYGLNTFQKGEQLISLDDVLSLHDFLTFIFGKFLLKRKDLHTVFGFMTFNSSSNIVPFYKVDGVHCFPIMYFEGDDDYLVKKSVKIGHFGEAVLRFLMGLQNVSNSMEEFRVITFDHIKKFFDPATKYAESWIAADTEGFLGNSRPAENSILRVRNVEEDTVKAPPSRNCLYITQSSRPMLRPKV